MFAHSCIYPPVMYLEFLTGNEAHTAKKHIDDPQAGALLARYPPPFLDSRRPQSAYNQFQNKSDSWLVFLASFYYVGGTFCSWGDALNKASYHIQTGQLFWLEEVNLKCGKRKKKRVKAATSSFWFKRKSHRRFYILKYIYSEGAGFCWLLSPREWKLTLECRRVEKMIGGGIKMGCGSDRPRYDPLPTCRLAKCGLIVSLPWTSVSL